MHDDHQSRVLISAVLPGYEAPDMALSLGAVTQSHIIVAVPVHGCFPHAYTLCQDTPSTLCLLASVSNIEVVTLFELSCVRSHLFPPSLGQFGTKTSEKPLSVRAVGRCGSVAIIYIYIDCFGH